MSVAQRPIGLVQSVKTLKSRKENLRMEEEVVNMGSKLNTALTSAVTGDGIIEQFIGILPWVGVMVGAAFLIYEARKLLKGASKGKVRV